MNREMFYDENDIKRFFKHVEKLDEKSCWNWLSAKTNGYGQFSMNGIQLEAHRVSYSIHKGEIEDGLFVMHTCDNPSCVNPAHLIVGTPLDNVTDRDKKGRAIHIFGDAVSNKGSKNGNSKLNEEQISEIINEYNNTNKTIKEIAQQYNVSTTNIKGILNRKFWKHLELGEIKRRKNKPINYEIAELIRETYNQGGHTMKDVGKIFNLSYTAINDIINYRSWVEK